MTYQTRRNLLTDAQWALIDERRRALGLEDDADLARALDVSGASVSRWRSREHGISGPTLERLARLLEVSLAELSDPDGFRIALGEFPTFAKLAAQTP